MCMACLTVCSGAFRISYSAVILETKVTRNKSLAKKIKETIFWGTVCIAFHGVCASIYGPNSLECHVKTALSDL